MEQKLITVSKKVCLLGEFAVGKTSLVRRFVYNLFDDRYISTIGVRVSRKTVAVPVDEQLAELTLMVWDLAGSEEFNRVSSDTARSSSAGHQPSALLSCPPYVLRFGVRTLRRCAGDDNEKTSHTNWRSDGMTRLSRNGREYNYATCPLALLSRVKTACDVNARVQLVITPEKQAER
jgi:hypothetical protein